MDILPWDGSHLGALLPVSLRHTYKYLNECYWCLDLATLAFTKDKISQRSALIWVQAKSIKDNHRVISDELKFIFKLPKIGTHCIKYLDKMYVLFKIRSHHQRIIYDLPLDQLQALITNKYHNISLVALPDNIIIGEKYQSRLTPEFIGQLQITWLFRDILGLSCSFNSSIHVRVLDDKEKILTDWFPISYRETNMVPYNYRLPMTIVKQWFLNYDETPGNIACKLFRVKSEKDIFEVTSRVSEQIQGVIMRIDKREIYLYRSMVDRLSQLLRLGIMNK